MHEEFKGVKCVALRLHQVKRDPAAEDVGDFAYVLKTLRAEGEIGPIKSPTSSSKGADTLYLVVLG